MATLLQLVQRAAVEMGLPSPAGVSGSTDDQVQQMFHLINAVGEELGTMAEWQRLQKETTITTTTATEYDLPTDFGRVISSTQWDRSNQWELKGPISPQGWQVFKSGITSLGPQLRWRLKGNKLNVDPTPTAGNTLAYEYISSYWVMATGDTTPSKALFTDDTDTCIYPDRLMIAGLKLKMWEVKGFDTKAYERDYRYRLSEAMGQDKGNPVLVMGGRMTTHLLNQANVPDTGYGA